MKIHLKSTLIALSICFIFVCGYNDKKRKVLKLVVNNVSICSEDRCCEGYKYNTESQDCVPDCMPKCERGICIGHDLCECDEGLVFERIKNICNPCDDGYTKHNNTHCLPMCENQCVNAQCISPNNCQCHPGFININSTVCILQRNHENSSPESTGGTNKISNQGQTVTDDVEFKNISIVTEASTEFLTNSVVTSTEFNLVPPINDVERLEVKNEGNNQTYSSENNGYDKFSLSIVEKSKGSNKNIHAEASVKEKEPEILSQSDDVEAIEDSKLQNHSHEEIQSNNMKQEKTKIENDEKNYLMPTKDEVINVDETITKLNDHDDQDIPYNLTVSNNRILENAEIYVQAENFTVHNLNLENTTLISHNEIVNVESLYNLNNAAEIDDVDIYTDKMIYEKNDTFFLDDTYATSTVTINYSKDLLDTDFDDTDNSGDSGEQVTDLYSALKDKKDENLSNKSDNYSTEINRYFFEGLSNMESTTEDILDMESTTDILDTESTTDILDETSTKSMVTDSAANSSEIDNPSSDIKSLILIIVIIIILVIIIVITSGLISYAIKKRNTEHVVPFEGTFRFVEIENQDKDEDMWVEHL